MVTISYHQRRISIPAIYVIDFIENNQFTVAPIFVVEKEIVISNTTGTETSYLWPMVILIPILRTCA